MPKPPGLSREEKTELRAEVKRRLLTEFRQRGDIKGVEILLGKRLPEIERWAIASNAVCE